MADIDNAGKVEAWKARGLDFFRYFGDAFCYAFLPSYMISTFGGDTSDLFGALKTGALLASIPLMAVIGNLIFGRLATNEKHNLFLLKIMMPIEVSFLVTVGFWGDNFAGVLVFSIIANLFNSAVYSFLDSIAGDIAAAEHANFASIRVAASISYMLSTLASAFLLAGFTGAGLSTTESYKWLFVCSLPSYVATYVIIYLVKPYDIDQYREETKDAQKADKEDISVSDTRLSTLFHNRNFMTFLAFIALYISMVFVGDNVLSSFWMPQGEEYRPDTTGFASSFYPFSAANLSMAYVVMMVAEITASFLYGSHANVHTYKAIFIFGAIASILRLFGTGLLIYFDVDQMYAYFLVSILRGFIWGACIAAEVPLIENIIGIKLKTKAIFLINMTFQGVTAMNQFAVPLLELDDVGLSYSGTFFLFGGVATIALILLLFVKVDKSKTGKTLRLDKNIA